MDLHKAFEREADELDRRLANGEINNREYRQAMRDLELDMEDAIREEYKRMWPEPHFGDSSDLD